MKENSDEGSRGLIAIFEKWMRGQIEAAKCIELINGFLKTYRARSLDASVNDL